MDNALARARQSDMPASHTENRPDSRSPRSRERPHHLLPSIVEELTMCASRRGRMSLPDEGNRYERTNRRRGGKWDVGRVRLAGVGTTRYSRYLVAALGSAAVLFMCC